MEEIFLVCTVPDKLPDVQEHFPAPTSVEPERSDGKASPPSVSTLH